MCHRFWLILWITQTNPGTQCKATHFTTVRMQHGRYLWEHFLDTGDHNHSFPFFTFVYSLLMRNYTDWFQKLNQPWISEVNPIWSWCTTLCMVQFYTLVFFLFYCWRFLCLCSWELLVSLSLSFFFFFGSDIFNAWVWLLSV